MFSLIYVLFSNLMMKLIRIDYLVLVVLVIGIRWGLNNVIHKHSKSSAYQQLII